MRKLKLQVQMSVDGYIADTNGRTGWMLWNWGEEWIWDDVLKKYFNDLTASVDCVLLSRKMAEEGFIAHWAKVAERLDDPQAAFASKIAEANKVVFTKTLHSSDPVVSGWRNTVLAKGNLAEEINQLKKQEGKDLIVYGGASFVSSLLGQNLIDELQLFINPVAIGSGMKIFNERTKLKLLNAQLFDCGITVLKYESSK